MKLFLAVLKKDGGLTAQVVERRAAFAEPALPFAGTPYRREIWLGQSGAIALVAWDNDVVIELPVELIVQTPTGARAMAGYVSGQGFRNIWDTGEVARAIAFTPAVVANLGGVFALIEVDDMPATVIVFNTVNRLEPVFWVETDEEIVIASRACILRGVMERVGPELMDLPMSRKRWELDADGPQPGEEERWLLRTPDQAPAGSLASFEWRFRWTTDMFDPFFEQIFRNRDAAALCNVLDLAKTESWFLARKETSPAVFDSYFAWGALTASVLIENRWLQSSRSPEMTRIQAPAI